MFMVFVINGEYEFKDNDKDDGFYYQFLKEILM